MSLLGEGTETHRPGNEVLHDFLYRLHLINRDRILAEGEEKIIVEYDRSKLSSEIEAKYYLYKRVGSVFEGNVKYHILFIGSMNERFFPATYIVEHSNIYMRDQNLHDCRIIHEEK